MRRLLRLIQQVIMKGSEKMPQVKNYFLTKWFKMIIISLGINLLSLVYYQFFKSRISIAHIQNFIVFVNSLTCLYMGVRQVTYDYSLLLQIKGKRQQYLIHMASAGVIGCLGLILLEKGVFIVLEHNVFNHLKLMQMLYRDLTLMMLYVMGSLIGSIFYRFSPFISICIIGSIPAIGSASLTWSILSENKMIIGICNLFYILISSLLSIEGILIYIIIFSMGTYGLLYKAPIRHYKGDLI